MTGTIFHQGEGRPLSELTEGYITKLLWMPTARSSGYQFVKLGKMMEDIRHGKTPTRLTRRTWVLTAASVRKHGAAKYIDPRRNKRGGNNPWQL